MNEVPTSTSNAFYMELGYSQTSMEDRVAAFTVEGPAIRALKNAVFGSAFLSVMRTRPPKLKDLSVSLQTFSTFYSSSPSLLIFSLSMGQRGKSLARNFQPLLLVRI